MAQIVIKWKLVKQISSILLDICHMEVINMISTSWVMRHAADSQQWH